MKTLLSDIWTAIRHNQATIVALILSAALCVWIYGCQSTAPSPLTGMKVTAKQIEVDVQSYIADREAKDKVFAAKTDFAYEEIERQDAFKNQLLNMLTAYTETTGVGTVVAPIFAILSTGLFVANRKKDSIITTKTNALESIKNGSNGS